MTDIPGPDPIRDDADRVVDLDAPIVAVTAYPGRARIVRRGRARVPGGTGQVRLGDLPLALDSESVRVTGRGPATILGVDVTTAPRATHDQHGAEGRLRAEQRDLGRRRRESADARAVIEAEVAVLQSLGARAGRSFATALAEGRAQPDQLAPVTGYLADQLTTAFARRRALEDTEQAITDDEQRVARELARLTTSPPDTTVVGIEVEARATDTADVEVELEVSYLVDGVHWAARYDVRLEGGRLSVDWFGLVSQRTGESWPPCQLRLSTAQPSAAVAIPELAPWYLRDRPPQPVARARTGMPAAGMLAAQAAAAGDLAMAAAAPAMEWEGAGAPAPVAVAKAVAEQGVTATTYTVGRPTPIPPDGAEHQVLLASFELPARLEHVTAPVRSDDVVLRVIATNDTEHTLRSGRAALFHAAEFVGATDLQTWSPGEEMELALGLDDRVRVERKLVQRSAGKALVGGTRRHEVRYRIDVANYGPAPVTVTVLDQVPVSTSAEIVVRDVHVQPKPQEVTDLGEVRWLLTLAAGAQQQLELGFRVDVVKQATLVGWRE